MLTIYHLPTGQRQNLNQLESNEYFGDGLTSGRSSIVITQVGKQIRFHSTWNTQVTVWTPGTPVQLIHDQTRAVTHGKVLDAFTGRDWKDPTLRWIIELQLERAGITLSRKYPISVFK